MSLQDFLRRLARTAFFAYLQHALRLLLRIVWLFIAGWLAGWSVREYFGTLQDERMWWGLGVLFAIGGIFSLGLPGSSLKYFAWRIDRRMQYGEQFSAALELNPESAKTLVAQALLAEISTPLRELSRRIFRRGWHLLKDAESLLIVSILLFMVSIAGGKPPPKISNGPLLDLPPLGTELGLLDVFPSDIPGVKDSAAEGLGGALGRGDDGEGVVGLAQDDMGEVGDLLADLGEELSEISATSEVGEALQQGDYQSAAEALESLSGSADELTEETRAEVGDLLQETADQMSEPGQEVLAEGLEKAAEGLESSEPGKAGEGLDELVDALNDLAAQDTKAVGEDEFIRLQGEADDLDFSVPSGSSTYLESDADVVEGEDVVLGPTDYVIDVGDGGTDSVYSPYDLDWKDRDVVEEYFSPQ